MPEFDLDTALKAGATLSVAYDPGEPAGYSGMGDLIDPPIHPMFIAFVVDVIDGEEHVRAAGLGGTAAEAITSLTVHYVTASADEDVQ